MKSVIINPQSQQLMDFDQNRALVVSSVICFQKKYGLHRVNHQITQYLKEEEVITDGQTDRLDHFCGRVRVKIWARDPLRIKAMPESAFFSPLGQCLNNGCSCS